MSKFIFFWHMAQCTHFLDVVARSVCSSFRQTRKRENLTSVFPRFLYIQPSVVYINRSPFPMNHLLMCTLRRSAPQPPHNLRGQNQIHDKFLRFSPVSVFAFVLLIHAEDFPVYQILFAQYLYHSIYAF